LTPEHRKKYNLIMKITGDRKGFTIIENIIVLVLLLVMIIASLGLYPAVLKFFVGQENRLIAGNYAYSQIEDLREIAHTSTLKLDDPLLTAGTYNVPTANVILPAGFTLTYTIVDNARPGNPAPPPADYKRVTVTCTHTASGYATTLIADVAP
jgi:type II secretory pathway pseudopilin PulG